MPIGYRFTKTPIACLRWAFSLICTDLHEFPCKCRANAIRPSLSLTTEIWRMNVWRKQTTKRGTSSVILSAKFYGTITTANGHRKQVPLTTDRKSSGALLARLQTQEHDRRAYGVTESTLERLRPIGEHLDAYAAYLRSKANTERYVSQTINRLKTLIDATKTKALSDLETERVAKTLSDLRQRGTSVSTSNHYARAIKGFSRWCYVERKTNDDSLRSLRLLNGNADRKRIRRALSSDELKRLIATTRKSGVSLLGLSPEDRSMLYTLAAYTGLRASELKSLTKASFDLKAGTICVQAAYSKRRRNDVLPLHASLIPMLKRWIVKKSSGLLWDGTWAAFNSSHVIRMLQSDLKRADIPYVVDGRYADFHALRHTFISSLARSGVHPSQAKELARHSTITLTMDVYSHVETEELRTAINTLNSFA